ncbi:hypothetical protein IHE44_0000436 [Lamprotornis superbus]|uniref:Uncharacterized protein n=1 Tax=Lamprotornis superbus TaxID=245042 RepID=A0A835NWS0_9PASS|nr:hypothetical protein IHE44_0000436 [Lamprotornis superbus]
MRVQLCSPMLTVAGTFSKGAQAAADLHYQRFRLQLCYHHLIYFSEFHNKNMLLKSLKNIYHQRCSSKQDTGYVMRFVAMNVLEELYKVLNHGPASSVKQAVMEMSPVEVIPVVIMKFLVLRDCMKNKWVWSFCFMRKAAECLYLSVLVQRHLLICRCA